MKIHSCVAFAVLALAGVTIAQNPKDVALLVGTWNRPKGNGTYSYTFKADGTYTGKTGALEGSISGTWKIKDGKLITSQQGLFGPTTLVQEMTLTKTSLTLTAEINKMKFIEKYERQK